MDEAVLVVIGVGGMGLAIARRLGSGVDVVLADYEEDTLQVAAQSLLGDGYRISTHRIDVSVREDVAGLARAASALDRPIKVVHTAGLSPVQASPEAILEVDLLGAALTLEEFGQVMTAGGAGVVISSMAGHLAGSVAPDEESALALTPADALLQLPCVGSVTDPGLAYALAKRANRLRVQAASATWGERGARVNSISPGIISTPMGRLELASASGEVMRAMVDASAAGRLGTPEEIAAATGFLLGSESSFITGTDLLVDGGVVAGLRSGRLDLAG